MTADNLFFYIELTANSLSLIILPIMTSIVGYRFIRDIKRNQYYNWIRFCIFGIFLGFSLVAIFEFLFKTFPPTSQLPYAEEILGQEADYFGLNNIAISIMVTFGLTMIAVTNRWKYLYYTPTFIIIGMYIIYLYSGFYGFLMPYIYGASVIALVFFYFTGIRLKDNGSLGLGIFFTFAFISLVATGYIDQILVFFYLGFGVILSLGLFKPYKESEEY